MKKFVSFALAIALVCTLAAAMAGAAFAADKADIRPSRQIRAVPIVRFIGSAIFLAGKLKAAVLSGQLK